MSRPSTLDRATSLIAGLPVLARVLAVAALLMVLGVWISSGSLVLALLVLLLVGGTAGLGVVVMSWAGRGRADGVDGIEGLPDALPTTDLEQAGSPAARIRRTLRGLLARPWVRGDGLVRAATARLATEDALVWTPRGQRVAAPHVWIEWNAADLAEIAGRWPLDVLADELAERYLEHARTAGVRRLADRSWVHLMASTDVPVGRVVVTAAFSRPQQTPLASASATDDAALAARSAALPPAPAIPALPPPPVRPAPARPAPPAPSRPATVVDQAPGTATAALGEALRRRLPGRAAPAGTLVSLVPGMADIVLGNGHLVLGRDPRAGAVIDHPGVSWEHLTISRGDARTWTVTDAGSTNGTLVGGERIAAPTVLRDGDTLALGADGPRYRLRVGPGPSREDRPRERTRVEVT